MKLHKRVFWITGGIGNQLFVYSAMLYFTKGIFEDVFVDKRNYNFDFRSYKLDDFGLKFCEAKFFTRVLLKKKLQKIISIILFDWVKFDHIEERDYLLNNIDIHKKNIVYYMGYWQYYEIYKNQIEIVRCKYTLNSKLETFEYAYWKNRILNEYTIGVHIRRGDYLKAANNEVFEVLPIEYYEYCIEELCRLNEKRIILFFTDDSVWVRSNFNIDNDRTVLISEIVNNDVLEFDLMLHCAALITANSTYSWWAGSLNKSQLIYAPKIFYKDSTLQDDYMNRKNLFNPKFIYV
jgi:hypothetical protein